MDYYKMTLHPKPAQILDPEVWRQPTFELMWAILHLRQGSRYGTLSSVVSEYRQLCNESKVQWVTMMENYLMANRHPVITDEVMRSKIGESNKYDWIWSELHKQQGSRQGSVQDIRTEYRALSARSKAEWIQRVDDYLIKNSLQKKNVKE